MPPGLHTVVVIEEGKLSVITLLGEEQNGYTRIPHLKVEVINPWSPAGSILVQKMAMSSPIPVFKGLRPVLPFMEIFPQIRGIHASDGEF